MDEAENREGRHCLGSIYIIKIYRRRLYCFVKCLYVHNVLTGEATLYSCWRIRAANGLDKFDWSVGWFFVQHWESHHQEGVCEGFLVRHRAATSIRQEKSSEEFSLFKLRSFKLTKAKVVGVEMCLLILNEITITTLTT